MTRLSTDPAPAPPSTRDRIKPSLTDRAYYVLRELARCMADVASTLNGDERVLDYGCGTMPYRKLFETAPGRYVGADLPDNPAADLMIDSAGEIPVPDGSFDIVLSSQVLEHVEDPQAYLSEARRILAPSGKLILSTHGSWRYHPHPEDYWRWTASGLRKVVKSSGFEVVRIHGVMGPFGTATQVWQDAALEAVPRPLRKLLTVLSQLLIVFQEKVTGGAASHPDACVYVVVAVKTERNIHGAAGEATPSEGQS
jgi:SAM-dependent methyltransferase